MSCPCFNAIVPPSTLSFKTKLQKSKCSCASRFIVKENKRACSIENNVPSKDLDKIKVDGCLINSSSTTKCDYLFIYKNIYLFVELKGTDIAHAISQLESVINLFYLEKEINSKTTIRGAVAFSTFPRDNGTYRKAKATLVKNLKSKFDDKVIIEERSKKINYNLLTDKFT